MALDCFASLAMTIRRPHLSFATTSMKRFTRFASTGFQVWPSTLKWVPITTPSAMARISRTLSTVTPVLAKTGTLRNRLANAGEVRSVDGLPGQRSGDQDRVGQRGEDGAFGAQGDRALVERMGELRVDVEEELHVVAAELAAQAQSACGIGAPKPHVGGEDAGEDLAHEARSGRGADGDAGDRVPEIVDAEGDLEMGLRGLDHRGHRRHPLGRRREDVGAIVLIAEHDRIDAARLQIVDVGDDAFDQLRDAAVRVIERRAGEGADVGHGDDDFRLVAEEVENHG